MILAFDLQTDGSIVLTLAAVVVGAGLYASVVLAASARVEYLRPSGPFTGLVHLTADDRAVSVVLPLLRQEFEWAAVESISEAGCIILWLEPGVGEYIPDRAFSSPQQRAAFVAFANARLATGGTPSHP
jgi:hypothetical protein